MKTSFRRAVGLGLASALAAGGALVATAGAANAEVIGSLTVDPTTGSLSSVMSSTTSTSCPVGATNFVLVLNGGNIVGETVAGQMNINGNAGLSSIGSTGGDGNPMTVPWAQTLELLDSSNGTPLAAGDYTVTFRCRTALQSASLGDFTGTWRVLGSGASRTWQFVAPAAAATTTTLAASPTGPLTSGDSTTLTATVSPAAVAGSVEFKNGATSLGTAPVSGGTASLPNVVLPAGSNAVTATFTPTDTATYAPSTSAPLTVQVVGVAVATTTLISGPTTATVGSGIAIHVDVNGAGGGAVPASAGSVKLLDGATVLGTKPLTATGAGFTYTFGAPGTKTFTAEFVPADPSAYVGSTTDTGLDVTATAAANEPDPQTVVVDVPAGDLVISSPYTPDNPFDLGTAALSTDGTTLTAQNEFGSAASPEAGVTVTDTRPGSTGWTASAASTDFENGSGGTITADKLSFVSVTPQYIAGNAITAVTPSDIAAFSGVPQAFATTTQGPGSVHISGTVKLSAPTSTLPGHYTATVTFTVV